ncbi:BMB_G0014340.mRNA.1.CDS.1 [Saccharomyces cerevisiae]|nr:BMB_G0014340.mRNA.1.CDS.1 [Saccharomyces cerevisiae]CAI7098614.1 BMB_G0014340.mRNA.1.CDS.1 [Saccharomyces cerevisiae]
MAWDINEKRKKKLRRPFHHIMYSSLNRHTQINPFFYFLFILLFIIYIAIIYFVFIRISHFFFSLCSVIHWGG